MSPHAVLPILLLFAAPYWVSKPPAEWTDPELAALLADSPWAQIVSSAAVAVPGPGVQVYLATAAPMQLAEKERDRRIQASAQAGHGAAGEPAAAEYRLWLEDNRTTQIVLAIRIRTTTGFLDEREVRRMEDESRHARGQEEDQDDRTLPALPRRSLSAAGVSAPGGAER